MNGFSSKTYAFEREEREGGKRDCWRIGWWNKIMRNRISEKIR